MDTLLSRPLFFGIKNEEEDGRKKKKRMEINPSSFGCSIRHCVSASRDRPHSVPGEGPDHPQRGTIKHYIIPHFPKDPSS
jgi:hypothetical protein